MKIIFLTLFDQRMQQQDDYHNDYRFLKTKFLEENIRINNKFYLIKNL